jgi:hypothetical protein
MTDVFVTFNTPTGRLVAEGEEDYALAEGTKSCWVRVGGIVLYIRRAGGDGAIVEAYRDGDEMADPLGTMEVAL